MINRNATDSLVSCVTETRFLARAMEAINRSWGPISSPCCTSSWRTGPHASAADFVEGEAGNRLAELRDHGPYWPAQ